MPYRSPGRPSQTSTPHKRLYHLRTNTTESREASPCPPHRTRCSRPPSHYSSTKKKRRGIPCPARERPSRWPIPPLWIGFHVFLSCCGRCPGILSGVRRGRMVGERFVVGCSVGAGWARPRIRRARSLRVLTPPSSPGITNANFSSTIATTPPRWAACSSDFPRARAPSPTWDPTDPIQRPSCHPYRRIVSAVGIYDRRFPRQTGGVQGGRAGRAARASTRFDAAGPARASIPSGAISRPGDRSLLLPADPGVRDRTRRSCPVATSPQQRRPIPAQYRSPRILPTGSNPLRTMARTRTLLVRHHILPNHKDRRHHRHRLDSPQVRACPVSVSR
mmetsp:Transcript_20552/g.49433  ORF Transcript_20552/g.49433 Transcript_20552/m.49433 type:complete len:333 (-) Transcript_20552:134-1132(-)